VDVCCSSQPERHRRSVAVRSRSDASDSTRNVNKPRRSSDCTDDVDSMSGDHVPLRDEIYGRRADDRDLYDYKVSHPYTNLVYIYVCHCVCSLITRSG